MVNLKKNKDKIKVPAFVIISVAELGSSQWSLVICYSSCPWYLLSVEMREIRVFFICESLWRNFLLVYAPQVSLPPLHR
jgi:hypothetical protein